MFKSYLFLYKNWLSIVDNFKFQKNYSMDKWTVQDYCNYGFFLQFNPSYRFRSLMGMLEKIDDLKAKLPKLPVVEHIEVLFLFEVYRQVQEDDVVLLLEKLERKLKDRSIFDEIKYWNDLLVLISFLGNFNYRYLKTPIHLEDSFFEELADNVKEKFDKNQVTLLFYTQIYKPVVLTDRYQKILSNIMFRLESASFYLTLSQAHIYALSNKSDGFNIWVRQNQNYLENSLQRDNTLVEIANLYTIGQKVFFQGNLEDFLQSMENNGFQNNALYQNSYRYLLNTKSMQSYKYQEKIGKGVHFFLQKKRPQDRGIPQF